MHISKKVKIAFLAYSVYGLLPYWRILEHDYDCWWAVTQEDTYQELCSLGFEERVVLCEDKLKYIPDYAGNKYRSIMPGKAEMELDRALHPDVWITDQTNRLTYVDKKVPWIQVFHSLCYKKHTFHPLTMKYDLLLVPGTYHKKRFLEIFRDQVKGKRIEMVGWPRADYFATHTVEDAQEALEHLKLDFNRKTILYAPTWGGYGNDASSWGTHLFSRWFDTELDVFEHVCRWCAENSVNFIIKLHNLSVCNENSQMQSMAETYGAKWITAGLSNLMKDPFPYLMVSDVLISDMSGIIMDYLPLNRPVVFIEPDESLDAWKECSIEPSLRPGSVVKDVDALLCAIEKALTCPNLFESKRLKVVQSVFSEQVGKSTQIAENVVRRFLSDRKCLNDRD